MCRRAKTASKSMVVATQRRVKKCRDNKKQIKRLLGWTDA